MSYTIPDFPSFCDVYTSDPTTDFLLKVFRLSTVCQLRGFGRIPKSYVLPLSFGSGFSTAAFSLLVPAGTDLRDYSVSPGVSDIVEAPSGSGRWYLVSYVDDVAKDFPNEYRIGILYKVFPGSGGLNFPYWPTPIP